LELVFLLTKRKNSKQKTEYVNIIALLLSLSVRVAHKLSTAFKSVDRIFVYNSICFLKLLKKIFIKCFIPLFSFFKFLNKQFKYFLSGFKCYGMLFFTFLKYKKEMKFSSAVKLHFADIRKIASKNVILGFRFSCAIATLAAVVLVGFSAFSLSNITFAVKVNYGGSIIGYVQNQSVVDEAIEIMSNNIAGEDASQYIYDTKLSMGVTSRTNIETSEQIAQTAIETTSELEYAYGLYIDDVLYTVCNNKSMIENSLSKILNSDSTDGNVEANFVQNVEISNQYFLASCVLSDDNIDKVINNVVLPLNVEAVNIQTYTEPLAFDSEKVDDENKSVGYKKVDVAGVEGTQNVTAKVISIDGVETGRTIVSKEIIAEPTTEVVVCGTKEVTLSSSKKMSSAITSDASMIWPVKSNSKMYISTYFGENGHQGIDITSPCGTDIYAADSGKVTFSGWCSNGYGNYIIIDHGDNKTETLYAHCSEMYVSVGDTVSAGQVIAAVGSTGQSTGNHLHFEVRINGTRVNPLGYVKQ